MSAHSSAPWTVETGVCRHDHPDTSADVLCANGDVVVANCGCSTAAIANARLIAAAPELLDACRDALAAAATIAANWPEQRGIHDTLSQYLATARAAIAKAEGARA